MTTTIATLPPPNKAHATCAWCNEGFGGVVELIDQVDAAHLDNANHDEKGTDARRAA